jgi:sec-independent protein translocase protein TatA
MIGGLGVQELLLIFLVVLLLFGAKRIPDIAHSLGKGLRDFKRAMQDTKDEINRSIEMPDDDKDKPKTNKKSGDNRSANGDASSK